MSLTRWTRETSWPLPEKIVRDAAVGRAGARANIQTGQKRGVA